jgi:hypothetical protein
MSAELKTATLKLKRELKILRTENAELKFLRKILRKEVSELEAYINQLHPPRQRHIIIMDVLLKLNDDVLDEARSLKFKDGKDLPPHIRKILEEVGEREFESLRELVDWLKSLTAVSFTKGALACRIMGKELVHELTSDVVA